PLSTPRFVSPDALSQSPPFEGWATAPIHAAPAHQMHRAPFLLAPLVRVQKHHDESHARAWTRWPNPQSVSEYFPLSSQTTLLLSAAHFGTDGLPEPRRVHSKHLSKC